MMKQVKKIVKLLLIVFAVMYILRRPGPAADTLRVGWQTASEGFMAVFNSAGRFVDALLQR